MTTASDRRVLALAITMLAASGCGGSASSQEPSRLHLFGHVYDRGTIELPSLPAARQRFGDLPVVSTSGSLESGSGTPLPTAVLLHTSAGYRNYDLSGAP